MERINKSTLYFGMGTLLAGILIGWLVFGMDADSKPVDRADQAESINTKWTCSMHPQIRQPDPGQCPICGMDLIPISNNMEDDNPMEIRMSPTAMQLANIQTSVISKQKPVKEIRMNGKVKVDERRIYSQTSHIPGRIEKLILSFTGEKIVRGQVLAYIYSPELINAQEELLEALKIKEDHPQLYEAAKGKLKNWKLTDSQIAEILERGTPQEQFPILADVSGVVMEKKVNLGEYVKKGQSLFEVVDLSTVWVLFDIYESDMAWVKKGQEVNFSLQSLPGESFKSIISFIDPVMNPMTRVATARVQLQNRGQKLKPEMFVSGVTKSPITGKGMAFIVPKSAVMWTGERSIVYVKKSAASGVSFAMQEVTLGPSLGDSYIIKEGLEEGVEIATHGTFSIDAAAQLAGKPSMMNPESTKPKTGHKHGAPSSGKVSEPIPISNEAKTVLDPLFTEYLLLKNALVADDFEKGQEFAASLLDKLSKTKMSVFTGKAHSAWMESSIAIEKALKLMLKSPDIGESRSQFIILSIQFITLANTFGPFDNELFVQHCPMADGNNGADWISNEKQIRNPYFGKSMLKCGKVTREIK